MRNGEASTCSQCEGDLRELYGGMYCVTVELLSRWLVRVIYGIVSPRVLVADLFQRAS